VKAPSFRPSSTIRRQHFVGQLDAAIRLSECPQCLIQTSHRLFRQPTRAGDDARRLHRRGQTHVIVDRPPAHFCANVFSPDDDGENDKLAFLPNRYSAHHKSFQVFDRWGRRVFARNFAPDDPTIGWDGRLKGKPMNPGVICLVCRSRVY